MFVDLPNSWNDNVGIRDHEQHSAHEVHQFCYCTLRKQPQESKTVVHTYILREGLATRICACCHPQRPLTFLE